MPKVIALLMLTALALLWPGCTPTPPPGDALPPRPIVVATPTPGAAQLRVTRAITQSTIPLPTASTALTLTAPLPLHLAAPPSGIRVIVTAEVENTGTASLALPRAGFTLHDSAGQVYARDRAAELALLDTPLLADQAVPPGAQATGALAFTVSPEYAPPLRLVARIPGSPPLTSAPFTLEEVD